MNRYTKDGGEPITEWELRKLHPNTCFPLVIEPRHAVEFGYEVYVEPPPPEPTTEEILESYERHLDAYLDDVAASIGFPNGRYAASNRAGYNNPWRQLATQFSEWMDNEVNAPAWVIKQEILAGTRPLPTWDEFLAMLPEFNPSV